MSEKVWVAIADNFDFVPTTIITALGLGFSIIHFVVKRWKNDTRAKLKVLGIDNAETLYLPLESAWCWRKHNDKRIRIEHRKLYYKSWVFSFVVIFLVFLGCLIVFIAVK